MTPFFLWLCCCALAPIGVLIPLELRRVTLREALLEQMKARRIPGSPLSYANSRGDRFYFWLSGIDEAGMTESELRQVALQFAMHAALDDRLPGLDPTVKARFAEFRRWRRRAFVFSALPAFLTIVTLLLTNGP